ncbi:MAG: hypothetical protein M3Y84_00255, partial [Acidobacteriota bacterium]|nr:hypothetical protein [Acidobacteriota bacterium]
HYFGQSFVRDLILELGFMCLGDLVVLTIDATQIAVAKENIPGAVRTYQRWFFSEMSGVGRNNWQPARIARRYLIPQSVIETVARADGAAFQQSLERFDSPP